MGPDDIRVEDKFAQSLITPCSVNEQQLLEESELTDCNICRSCSLKTFDTRDTDSDMSSLNHADIVRTVSDS